MDHSIKKKPEKPRLSRFPSGKAWACRCPVIMSVQPTGTAAYQEWKRLHAEHNQAARKS